jgi:hypothetical protein
MKRCLSLIFLMLCIVACRQPPAAEINVPAVEIKDYPFMPMELFVEQGDIQLRRVPMHTFDRAYRAATYTPEGEITAFNLAAILFPTDVIAIYLEDMDAPQVFLGLAPNSGCILHYDEEEKVFSDPCYGSTFTLHGAYIAGPAQQDLDRLPSEVRGNMLWIRNEIIYSAVKEDGRGR